MKTSIIMLTLGSMITLGTIYYVNNENMINKKVKRMLKQNEEAMKWIKEKFEM